MLSKRRESSRADHRRGQRWLYRSATGAVAYARRVAILYALLALMRVLPAPFRSTFGQIPIDGHDVWLHALTALIAAYFGWAAPVETLQAGDASWVTRRYGAPARGAGSSMGSARRTGAAVAAASSAAPGRAEGGPHGAKPRGPWAGSGCVGGARAGHLLPARCHRPNNGPRPACRSVPRHRAWPPRPAGD